MDFRTALSQFNIDDAILDSATADFSAMTEKCVNPNEYWECMGQGLIKSATS